MTFPTGSSRVWVRGRFVDLGRAARGEEFQGQREAVRFDPSPEALLDAGTQQILSVGPFTVSPQKQDGHFAVLLPATDDPAVVPTGWTYLVTEPGGRTYSIVVPLDTPALNAPGDPLHGQKVIDLISVVPAASPSAGTVQLMTGRGIASMVIDEAGDLVVTYSDGTSENLGLVVGGGADLAARVDAIDVEQDTQDDRLDALEGAGPGGALSYEHTQPDPATVWLVEHGLSFRPAGVVVVDHIGDRHFPVVTWPAAGTVQLSFNTSVRGTAHLS